MIKASTIVQMIRNALQPLIEELAQLASSVERVGEVARTEARAAVRIDTAEQMLRIEQRLASLRDGKDGVGIRTLAQTESGELEIEFTNEERVLVALPKGDPGSPGLKGDPGLPGLGVDVPHWSPGIHREGTLVQHFLGRSFRAVRDTAGEPGSSPDWQRLGLLGLRWCGPLEETRRYEPGDIYVDGGTFLVVSESEVRCLAGKVHSPSDIRSIAMRETSPLREQLAGLRDKSDQQFAIVDAHSRTLEALQAENNELRAAVKVLQDMVQQLWHQSDGGN